jgi:ribonuclease HII
MTRRPDFRLEAAALARGIGAVAGVDEAGRGPLAGPVVAAAVVLDPARLPEGLDDSKRLGPRRCAALAPAIRAAAVWALGIASVAEIDRLNILAASHLAMQRALAALPVAPGLVLIDGNRLPPGLPCPAEAVVGGDRRCLSIAAASILAKVARDAIMAELDRLWPGYGWARNAGYPSAAHLAALIRLGPTPHHRRSFAPVRALLPEEHPAR